MTKAAEHYWHYIWDTPDERMPGDEAEIGCFALRQMERRLRQLKYQTVTRYGGEISRLSLRVAP